MGMENLQSVYEANAKRLQESRTAQTTTPDYIQNYQKSLVPQYNVSFGVMNNTPAAPGYFSPTANLNKMTSSLNSPQPTGSTDATGRPLYNARGELINYGNATASPGKSAAMQLWDQQNQAFNKANEDTLIDRGSMLKELADFKAQSVMNNQNMEKELSDLDETLKGSANETLDKVRNSFAAMGRTASPYVMAGISARLALQNKDKLNLRRSQLEMDRAQIHGVYIDKLNQVLAGTKRNVMDPQTVLAMMKYLGGGDAGGGGFITGGGRITTGGGGRSSGGGNTLGGAGGQMPVASTDTFYPSEMDQYANQRGSGAKYVDTASVNQRPVSINPKPGEQYSFASN